MKKLLLSIGLLLGGVAFVNAQDTTSVQPQPQQSTTTTSQDQQREQVQVSDLPDPVKRAIESQDYQGWTVAAAYKSTMSDSGVQGENATKAGEEIYILDLRNGAETKTVKFDKDGNKLDKEQKDDQKK